MKFRLNDTYTTIAAYALIVALVMLLFVLALLNFGSLLNGFLALVTVLRPINYGLVFAFLLLPLVKLFESALAKFIRRKRPVSRLRRILSILLAYLVAAAVIMLFVLILLPQVSASYKDLENKISGYITTAQGWLDKMASGSEFFADQYAKISDVLDEFITDTTKLLTDISPYLLNFVRFLVNEMKNILIGLILAVYILMSKEKLAAGMRRFMRALLGDRTYRFFLHVTRLTYVTFSEFITGETMDATLMGMILFALMKIFQMPYAPLISLIVGITCFIPSIGAYIGAVPGILIIFIVDPHKTIWFVLMIIVLQQLNCIFIEPKILSEQNEMSALWVLTSIIVMSALLGVWGLIIGVPCFMIVRTLIRESLDLRLRAKGLPVRTSAYYDMPAENPAEHDEKPPQA